MSKELEPTAEVISAALDKLTNTSVTLDDLATIFAPKEIAIKSNGKLPVAKPITSDEFKALENLKSVYGKVVPQNIRLLYPDEVGRLSEERQTLDQIQNMVDRRKADIRTTILNHFDMTEELTGRVDNNTLVDKDGHYLVEDAVEIPDTEYKFTREIRQSSPGVSPTKLQDAVGTEAWEAMTVETRVFDEHKAILYLREHPELLIKIAESTVPGRTSSSLNIRKIK